MEKRLVDLEVRYTHLERLLDELNLVLFAQQRQIDGLEKQVQALRARLADAGDQVANEPPPHY
jgi:SlyX protein